MEKGVITLSGNVTLTQGDSILKGKRLEIDLKTGKNTMKGESDSIGKTTEDGRVKGLFVPKKRN